MALKAFGPVVQHPKYDVGGLEEKVNQVGNDTLKSSTKLNGSLVCFSVCSSCKKDHLQIDLCVIHANSSEPHVLLDP